MHEIDMSVLPLRTLLEKASRKTRNVAGMLSGTSVDSIHIAFCKIRGAGLRHASVELIKLIELPYDRALREELRAVESLTARDVAELNVRLGKMFGLALIKAAKRGNIALSSIDLIGSHGQTVYHHSSKRNALRATLQLGDGDVIAELTRIPVISDFRARDVAAGGEGAPLTPYADAVLYRAPSRGRGRLVLNLGGVANVTVLSTNPEKIRGFDCGPANGPLDRLARIYSKGRLRCDLDGRLARQGKIDDKLVARLLKADQYLRKPPPKSTGFEMYGDRFIESLIDRYGEIDPNLIASITDFCAQASAFSLRRFVSRSLHKVEIVLAGGGARNPVLVERLKVHCYPADIVLSDSLAIPCEAREAMAFALFANEALCGETAGLPSITGVTRPTILGKLSW